MPKIYKDENYVIIDDAGTITEFAISKTVYNTDGTNFLISETGVDSRAANSRTIPLSEIVAGDWTDNDLNAYDQNTFVSFLRASTGFKAAPGGSGAGGCMPLKSGQTDSYALYDDGALQEGRDVDLTTLDFLNPFGTTERETDINGGQVYADDIVLDWNTWNEAKGTVLAYYRVLFSGKNHTDLLADCFNHSVGAFTSGWRAANWPELVNIWNIQLNIPFSQAPYNINSYTLIWESGTLKTQTGNAKYILSNGAPNIGSKAATTGSMIAVRTMTVTGTTIS